MLNTVNLFAFVMLTFFVFSRPSPVAAFPQCGSSHPSPQSTSIPTAPDDDLLPLPYLLSAGRLSLLQSLAVSPFASEQTHHPLAAMFFQTLYEHPLTARQVAIRDSVLCFAGRRSQYIRVRLLDHTVLTGTISGANRRGFVLQTDNLHFRRITYNELSEPARPLAAVGTRMVRGLETAGVVVAIIVLVPIALPLMMAGVLND